MRTKKYYEKEIIKGNQTYDTYVGISSVVAYDLQDEHSILARKSVIKTLARNGYNVKGINSLVVMCDGYRYQVNL